MCGWTRRRFTVVVAALVACTPDAGPASPTDEETDEEPVDDTDANDSDAGSGAGAVFEAEGGVRIENASVPEAGIDPETGETVVYWYATEANHLFGEQMSVSTDGLAFPGSEPVVEGHYPNDSRRVHLPDGTWRRYFYDVDAGGVVSQSSADGIDFTDDREGEDWVVRYAPADGDGGVITFTDAFTDSSDGVVLLYSADPTGRNNVRRAYSSDGGDTFAFTNGNVLGDDAAGGGGNAYVDQMTIALADGGRRLYAMKGGQAIHTFRSDDDGVTFAYEGEAIHREAWTEVALVGIFNPTVVSLPDGSYRLYVDGNAGGGQEEVLHVLSAISVAD